MNDDLTLLRDFARSGSEPAFAMLVERHVNLVYSVARRQVRDPHLAEEITQAVFIILARKANVIGGKTILPGWLCRTARYAGSEALRNLRRRRRHEQEAHMQTTLNPGRNDPPGMNDAAWSQMAPVLDDALEKLGPKDHDALVLRFFQNKNFAEVGAALGATEDAAKKRVGRALEKLRQLFHQNGVDSTAEAIASSISAHSIQVTPVALAKTVTAVAIAKGAAASGSTLTLIQGALKIMAWTKAKTAMVAGMAVLLIVGVTTITVDEFHGHLHRVHVAEMAEYATPPQYGLAVGPSLLGWSVHENSATKRTGYIYMRDVDPGGGGNPLWEFAFTAKRQLSEVTPEDLRSEFYGMNDPRGPVVFGTAWEGSAIVVPEGQIFLARLMSNRSVIYVVRMAKQGRNKSGHATMQIEYREFNGRPFSYGN